MYSHMYATFIMNFFDDITSMLPMTKQFARLQKGILQLVVEFHESLCDWLLFVFL